MLNIDFNLSKAAESALCYSASALLLYTKNCCFINGFQSTCLTINVFVKAKQSDPCLTQARFLKMTRSKWSFKVQVWGKSLKIVHFHNTPALHHLWILARKVSGRGPYHLVIPDIWSLNLCQHFRSAARRQYMHAPNLKQRGKSRGGYRLHCHKNFPLLVDLRCLQAVVILLYTCVIVFYY